MHKSPERLFVEPGSNKCSCGTVLHPWRLRYDWCEYRRYTYGCLHLSAGKSDVHLEMLCSSVAFTICSCVSSTHRLLAVCFQAALLAPINAFLIFVYLFILAQQTDDFKGLQQCWKNEFCSVSRSLLLSALQSFVLSSVAVVLSSNTHGMSLRLSLSHCHHVMQHKKFRVCCLQCLEGKEEVFLKLTQKAVKMRNAISGSNIPFLLPLIN